MAAQFALNPQILKSVPLFSLFSDAQLAQLLTCVQHRSYPRNSFILRAGEETDALYLVLSGRVKVLIPDEEGHEVILSIMDNGTGIPAELLPRIFDPFVTNKETGTGLGLTITHEILEQHQGRVQAENIPTGGAKFSVWLPMWKETAE